MSPDLRLSVSSSPTYTTTAPAVSREQSPQRLPLVRRSAGCDVHDVPTPEHVGAAQVGMKTIFARYGDTFGTMNSHADFEVDDISELIEIVRRENARG